MLTFVVGWGIFWLLIWAVVGAFGWFARLEGMTVTGIAGAVISLIYLVAVGLANLLT